MTCTAAMSAYALLIATKADKIARCLAPIGSAGPHSIADDSRAVQVITQSRSTEPKNSGAKLSAAIVM